MATEYVANRGGMDGFTAAPDKFSRQAVGLNLGGPFVKATGAQVRGGVIPANGNPLGYVATSGLSASLKAGVYLLPTTADIGPVEVVVHADTVLTHATAHASQPRADLIIVEVVDNGDSTSTKKVRILTGTAGAGSPDPTLPSSLGNGAVVAIHRVLIPAASSTLSTITDLRTYTAGAGGMVPVANWAAASTLPVSTPIRELATGRPGMIGSSGAQLFHPGVVRLSGAGGSVLAGTLPTSPYTQTEIIEQTTNEVITLNASGDGTWVFPVPFPNGVLHVELVNGDISTRAAHYAAPYPGTTTLSQVGFRVYAGGGSAAAAGPFRLWAKALGW